MLKKIIAFFVALFSKRPTIVVDVCLASGVPVKAVDACPNKISRRYYVDELPKDTCTIHAAAEEPEPEPVTIEVCKVCGLLPGPNSKGTEFRTFDAGFEPTRPCSCAAVIPQADHTAPRTGMDFYQMIAFTLTEIKNYLDALAKNGGSLLRIFFDFIWPVYHLKAGWLFSIFKQIGWYTEPSGPFKGRRYPLFTVTYSAEYGEPWNEPVWIKYAAILKLAAERAHRVTVSVFDGCSMKNYSSAPDQTRYQPLLQNVQHFGAKENPTDVPVKAFTRMDGSTGQGYGIHTGGVYGGFGGDGGTMKSYLPPLVKKLVAMVRASGVDYRIMPGNEMERRREGTETQADVDRILFEWHDYFISLLKAEGVPAERIVISITGTNTRTEVTLKLKAKYPGIVEQIHGPNSDEALQKAIDANPDAEYDGDGQDPRAAGYDNGMMTLPSADQCRKIRAILARTGRTYQTFNAWTETPGTQDIAKARWDEQRALAGR